MTQRIKDKSELPVWFSLEKYQLAGALDAAGWYVQLSIRERCLSHLFQGDDISEILHLIRDAPAIDVTKRNLLSFHCHSGMFYEQPIIEQSICGVHSLTVYELYMAGINIEESKRTQAKAFFDEIFCAPESPREPPLINGEELAFLYEPVHRVSSYPPDNVLLGINLLLPDKELIEQFKTSLPMLRKECGAALFSAKWRKPDFAVWVRLGVLPYLDLMIWEKETGAKIPYQVMEEAIFITREGSEDRVRKTTAPKAKELTSKKSLALLRAQATTTVNGFMSADSSETGVQAEYYAAAPTVEAGKYDVFVNYFGGVGTTTATLYYNDGSGAGLVVVAQFVLKDATKPDASLAAFPDTDYVAMLSNTYGNWRYDHSHQAVYDPTIIRMLTPLKQPRLLSGKALSQRAHFRAQQKAGETAKSVAVK